MGTIDASKPLVSVIVLSYKNYNVIFDTINSILNQDYPEIELIISNDSSDDFDVSELEETFQDYKNKYPNIKNLIINKNKTNIGTVKHVNEMVRISSGKYFKLIAADDVFLCDDALSQYVDYMEKNPEAFFVVAQSAAYSNDLKEFLRYIPTMEQMDLLATSTAHEQFQILAQDCIINAPAVFFSRRYIETFGYFDDRYFFADDWPAWISFTRSGHRILTLNKTLVVYRFGGISNTNVYNPSDIGNKVLDEYFEIMYNEGVCYSKILGRKATLLCRKLCLRHTLLKNNKKESLKAILKNLDICLIWGADQYRKNKHIRFLILQMCILSLFILQCLCMVLSEYPTIYWFLRGLSLCNCGVFWLIIVVHFAIFIYDFCK